MVQVPWREEIHQDDEEQRSRGFEEGEDVSQVLSKVSNFHGVETIRSENQNYTSKSHSARGKDQKKQNAQYIRYIQGKDRGYYNIEIAGGGCKGKNGQISI